MIDAFRKPDLPTITNVRLPEPVNPQCTAREMQRSMPTVNLSVRLLIAFGCIAVLSTAMVGILVRGEWRRAENERFEAQVLGASEGIALELRAEQHAVNERLRSKCQHDTFVDRTLVDIEAGRLSSDEATSTPT
ncbi:MAG: hypothetical protein CSA75_04435, partial [Sorangium cellulosum]